MRTPTGDYRVDYFNKYGERVIGLSVQAGSLVEAHVRAKECWPSFDADAASSYTIMRCIFNSLDKRDFL